MCQKQNVCARPSVICKNSLSARAARAFFCGLKLFVLEYSQHTWEQEKHSICFGESHASMNGRSNVNCMNPRV
jgi:hypothetical protein